MNRGIVITPNYSITPNNGLHIHGGIDPITLRQYMLFWDKIDYPTNNMIHIGGGNDIEFLKDVGIGQSTRILFKQLLPHENGLIMFNTQMAAYEINNKNEEEEWSIAQPTNTLFVPPKYSVNQGSLIFELYNAIQIPTEDVPLEDVYKFKKKRESELLELRDSMDTIVNSIIGAGNIPKQKTKAISKLHRDLNDFNRVMKESKFQRVKRSLQTVATDPLFGVASAAGVMQGLLPERFQPYFQTLNIAALGACAVKFAYKEMAVGRDVPERFRQFAYLNSINREFGV
ncbi:hypothetical protein KW409_17615 [Vibrio fluvialis]|nr:hypothetical protein [Vibrio fluvialis]